MSATLPADEVGPIASRHRDWTASPLVVLRACSPHCAKRVNGTAQPGHAGSATTLATRSVLSSLVEQSLDSELVEANR